MVINRPKPTNKTPVARAAQQAARQLPDGSGVSASTVDSFINFQHKLGIGADNVLSSSTYGFNPITRNRIQLEWIHRGSWLGGIAINVVAADMTRAGVEYATELPAEASDQMDEEAVTLGIWQEMESTLQWGRLYGGAICVALIEGQDMRTPLDISTVGPGQFKGLLTLDRWMLDPSLEDLVTTMGPDLGKPRFYRVQSSAPALRGQTIHYTRVMLRHVGAKLPYNQSQSENLWGCSVIERLYDRMQAFDLASTGAAQLVTKAYIRTMKVDGLRDIAAAGGPAMEGLAKYTDFMRRMQGIEGMTLIDAKDEMSIDGHQAFSGLSDALSSFAEQLSGALEIPLIRLFGQSPGGFSDGDANLRNYYDHISKAQQTEMMVGVTKVYRMMAQSNGIKLPPDFRIQFRSLWQMDMPEKVAGAKTLVEAVIAAYEGCLISQRGALRELRQSSRAFGIFSNITEADIEAADDVISSPAPSVDEMLAELGTPGAPGGPGGPPLPPGLPEGFGPEFAAGAAPPAPPSAPGTDGSATPPPGLPTGFGGEHVRPSTARPPRIKLPAGFGPQFAAPDAPQQTQLALDLPEGFGGDYVKRTDYGNHSTFDAAPGPIRKAQQVSARQIQRVRIQHPASFRGQAGGRAGQGAAAAR